MRLFGLLHAFFGSCGVWLGSGGPKEGPTYGARVRVRDRPRRPIFPRIEPGWGVHGHGGSPELLLELCEPDRGGYPLRVKLAGLDWA